VSAGRERVVDALGTWCPVPIYLIDRAARRSPAGAVIELLADDPLIEVDLPAWCHTSGHALLDLRREGDAYVGRVEVTSGPRGANGPPRDPVRGRSANG
jgi:tRNA 2-thiouridine synthesizing protein A